MPLNEKGTQPPADGSITLTWGAPDKTWHKSVRDIFLAAKKNPHSAFWYQSDVAILRATCDFHHRMLITMVEPNAAVFKAIMERYDSLNLSLRGRNLSGLTVAPKAETDLTDETITAIATAISGKLNLHPEDES